MEDARRALHSLLIVMLGNTALNVALPTLPRPRRQVRPSSGSSTPTAVFAGLLFTMSSLGERFGRKGIMQLGLVLFGARPRCFAQSADS